MDRRWGRPGGVARSLSAGCKQQPGSIRCRHLPVRSLPCHNRSEPRCRSRRRSEKPLVRADHLGVVSTFRCLGCRPGQGLRQATHTHTTPGFRHRSQSPVRSDHCLMTERSDCWQFDCFPAEADVRTRRWQDRRKGGGGPGESRWRPRLGCGRFACRCRTPGPTSPVGTGSRDSAHATRRDAKHNRAIDLIQPIAVNDTGKVLRPRHGLARSDLAARTNGEGRAPRSAG